uniref:Putative secreted protein n=1 Tax=Anopheles marajoara TaxID=58244 RepID=A0A2M4CAL5_9DIPT
MHRDILLFLALKQLVSCLVSRVYFGLFSAQKGSCWSCLPQRYSNSYPPATTITMLLLRYGHLYFSHNLLAASELRLPSLSITIGCL